MQLQHAHHLRAANLIGLAAMLDGIERSKRDRPGEVANIDRLEIPPGGNHRQDRQPCHPGEAVGKLVLGSKRERRADDRRGLERLADGRLAFGLGPPIIGLRFRVGADRRDVDERTRPGLLRRFGDVASATDMDGRHLAPEHPDEVDRGGRAVERPPNRLLVGDVGFNEAELADLAQGLDEIAVARVAAGHADPDPRLHQLFADIAADESVAAEDGDELVRTEDHVLAFALQAWR